MACPAAPSAVRKRIPQAYFAGFRHRQSSDNMTHDPSNPFHKLVDLFPPVKGAKGGKRSGVPVSSAPAGKKPASQSFQAPAQESDDDADLFLQAMSSARPLQKKKTVPHPDDSRLSPILASAIAAGRSCEADAEPSAAAASGVTEVPSSKSISGAKSNAGFSGLSNGPSAVMASAHDEEHLFTKAMQGVSPVTTRGRDIAVPVKTKGAGPSADAAKALRDVLEGRVEFALHHTDEYMEGYVVGVDPLLVTRLRSGQFSPEAHLDLHGQNAVQAHDSLTWFIKNSYQRNMRTVLVVTGRGKNSADGVGVLRPLLQQWLCKDPFKRVVLAFCTAKSSDGGPGAVYVLLRKYKKSRGKIVWEHTPSDADFPDF